MLFHWLIKNFLEYGDLPIYVNTVSPGGQFANQLHDHDQSVELALVSGGRGIHWETPHSAPVSRGDILLIPRGVLHGYRESETLELKNIVFSPGHLSLPLLDASDMPFFRRLFDRNNMLEPAKLVAPVLHLKEDEFDRIESVFERMKREFDGIQPGRQFILLALLMEILLELSRLYSSENETLNTLWLIGDAVAYMQKNYARPITMEQVSRASGVSRRNLFRHFKKRLNCTPLTYLTKLRLQKVMELLTGSDLPLGEIALHCGFCDSNYLSKQFAAEYGISPGRWRQKIRMNRKNLSGDK